MKYYINKENAAQKIEELTNNGRLPLEYLKAAQQRSMELKEGQYLIIENRRGSGIIMSSTDSAKVPLSERINSGEKIDPTYYL